MDLPTLWFVLVAFFWAGYFLLEGFDFGVGMLLPFLPRDERERRILFGTIGPVWDGNEVWLVVAGGATFAAFPAWYATLFSGFYLALLLLLFFLIVRVVSFEWRSRSDDPRWQAVWLWTNAIGSFGASLVWGIGLSNLLFGVPINGNGDFAGDFLDLFNIYTVLAGVAFVLLFAFHGATFLTLRTTGDLCARALATARQLAFWAALVTAAFLVTTVTVAVRRNDKDLWMPLVPALCGIAALALAVLFVRQGSTGRAFAMTAAAAVLSVATLFIGLYPRVMVSNPDFRYSLTVDGAASAHYTLVVLTVVALITAPVILLYQGWTYRVFRHRLGGEPEPAATPDPLEPVSE